MKGGLRLQLLGLLGTLLLLFYAPLFFATSTYTKVGLEKLQRENAAKLGQSVAAHLAVERRGPTDRAFLELARAQMRKDSVHALSLIRKGDEPFAVLGDVELLRSIASQSDFGERPEVRAIQTPKGPAVLVFEPDPFGGVAAIVRVDPEVTRATPLARLMGLYMVVGGLALLAAAYFALTRWIVRPILQLESDAQRMPLGGRIRPLEKAPRELLVLSHRLSEMTEQVRQDEESLRRKIDELEELTTVLKEAQQSLVRSERLATVGRLAAGLAHEVGNPISALMGLQALLQAGGLSAEEERDFLARMRKETERIDRVLSDLLAYARPSAERPQKRPAGPGDVRLAVEDVIALLRPQSTLQGISLEADVAEDLPRVPLSQEELTQVLLNLVMNAADACGNSGRILIRLLASGSQVVLTVEDDGPGIDEDVRESLFEPFVTTKEVGQGTGLGLSVTRGLIESAAGEIHAEQSPLGGACFRIELPRAT